MLYQKGDKINILVGRYAGQNAIIFDIHVGFNPVHYSCKTVNGTELLYREDEIQSMYSHDMEMLKYR